ncbi:MAG: DUF4350 domain-containing protein [Sphingorhabdus sp.]
MSHRKSIFWIAALCALLILVTLVWVVRSAEQADIPQRRLAILSSIALQYGEGDLGSVVKGKASPDPLIERLAQSGTPVFVDSIAELQAAKPDVAILIQPRALSPDELVRLDNWVRAGGRLLLFADPALQWPSELPFGDPQRPLFTSMLSPILAHWGLELALPVDEGEPTLELNHKGQNLQFASPGNWVALSDRKKRTGNCRIDISGFLAECWPGKGQAILIADADMLHSDFWRSGLGRADSNDTVKWVAHLIDALSKGERIIGKRG